MRILIIGILLVYIILKSIIPNSIKIVNIQSVNKIIEIKGVTATCYNATKGQCDSSPFITSIGYKVNKVNPEAQRYLAVSRDLLGKLNYGDTVWVIGTFMYDGPWIIADIMNKKYSQRIDFLVGSHNKLSKWDNVSLYVH